MAYKSRMSGGKKGKKASVGGKSGMGHYADHGKAPNWDGKKQGPSKTNKGFGPC